MSMYSYWDYWTDRANEYRSYSPNSAVNNAYSRYAQAYNAYRNSLDGGFAGYIKRNGLTDYTKSLNGLLTDIINSKYSYNAEQDGANNAYKEQYRQNGMLQQKNTMAQALGSSGFLTSSYAQSAGNTAYQNEINKLSQVQSQLMNMAYNKYQNNLSNKQNIYDIYNAQSENQYNRYQNDINNKYNDMKYASDDYIDAYNINYNKWNNDRNYAQSNMQFYGNAYQSEKSLDQSKSIADRDYALRKKQAAL